MFLPKNSDILLSLINTMLRDKYSSLNLLCDEEDVSVDSIVTPLENAGYYYNEELNAFVLKD
ncbi:MAG: DUF4250 domain-containing protein [Clostridia bacterium]|nr:DUF4250 domain-containing protein [Clostridia bacterium]